LLSSSNARIPREIPLKYSSFRCFYRNNLTSLAYVLLSSMKQTTTDVISSVLVRMESAFSKLRSLNRSSQINISDSSYSASVVTFMLSSTPIYSIRYCEKNLSRMYFSSSRSLPTISTFLLLPYEEIDCVLWLPILRNLPKKVKKGFSQSAAAAAAAVGATIVFIC